MNSTEHFETFEELLWCDPSVDKKTAVKSLKKLLKSMSIEKTVYPSNLLVQDVNGINLPINQAPDCLFVPKKKLLRSMIDLVSKSDTIEEIQTILFAN
jgi:hypothetical protein